MCVFYNLQMNEFKQMLKSKLFLIILWDLFNVRKKVVIVRQDEFLLKPGHYSFPYSFQAVFMSQMGYLNNKHLYRYTPNFSNHLAQLQRLEY